MVRVNFVRRQNGPQSLLAEAEILFEGNEMGPLKGTKLVGFSLWGGANGEVYATFPSRAFGAGQDRRYFDYLRSVDGNNELMKGVKAWLVDEFKARAAEGADAR